jgi:DNA-binding winged helix-turn-helix (wHTH) protein/TolB-like protein/Flp pilus assembly protein TadD
MSEQTKHFYEFANFRIDTAKRLLLREGKVVPLTPKAFDTLIALVENSGRVMEKDDLMKRLWPDTIVEEANLTQSISVLRKALGESPNEHKFIVTVPGRGYKFAADVKESGTKSSVPEKDSQSAPFINEELKTTGQMWESIRLKEAETGAVVKSIAVLPFKSLGPDGGDEYLGLGMADAIIIRLSNIKQIVVRPTSAVLKYSAPVQNALKAGRELCVDYILEGHFQKSEERIRITVQLISVENGKPLWADRFDEKFTGIFTVQDSISEQLALALMLKLTGEEKKLLTKRYTDNTEAYQLYLKGCFYGSRWTSDGLKEGIKYFNQAIEMDPTYALAYAGLAGSYALLGFGFGSQSPGEEMLRAKAAAIKALEIDETLSEAHASLALVRMHYDWDWLEAEREYGRAIELNPNYAEAREGLALCLGALGRHTEAIEEIKKAQELDPLSLTISMHQGLVLYFARHFDQAISAYRKTLRIEPHFSAAHNLLGLAYEQKGMYEEAIAELEKARELDPRPGWRIANLGYLYAISGKHADVMKILEELKELRKQSYIPPVTMAEIYAALGNKDSAFEWLERAYEERDGTLVFLKVAPMMDCLRTDPRFATILQRMNLA